MITWLSLLSLFCLTALSSPYVWPINATLTPNLPQSSPFGPRLKASESFRYDFHRGIDIPCPLNTTLVAIDDGVVRLAGMYPGVYSDMVCQIKSSLGDTFLYATYIHLNGVTVNVGDSVVKGQIIGYSGASYNGFAHLHFETRIGGYYQRHCRNPWGYLPYQESPNLPLFSRVNMTGTTLDVEVTVPSSQLVLDRVWLTLDTPETGLALPDVSFNALTGAFSANVSTLDNPYIPSQHVTLSPSRYNGNYWDNPSVLFRFDPITVPMGHDLVVHAGTVTGGHTEHIVRGVKVLSGVGRIWPEFLFISGLLLLNQLIL